MERKAELRAMDHPEWASVDSGFRKIWRGWGREDMRYEILHAAGRRGERMWGVFWGGARALGAEKSTRGTRCTGAYRGRALRKPARARNVVAGGGGGGWSRVRGAGGAERSTRRREEGKKGRAPCQVYSRACVEHVWWGRCRTSQCVQRWLSGGSGGLLLRGRKREERRGRE